MTYFLFGDGGSRGNPGPAASGFVVFQSEINLENFSNLEELKKEVLALKNEGKLEKVVEKGIYLGNTTNNQAEWQSLIFGLEAILKLQKPDQDDNSLFESEGSFGGDASAVRVVVFLDSELVVKQSKGTYKVKNPDLKGHFIKLKELQKKFAQVDFIHVYREFNKEADGLVNQALDERE